MQFNALILLDYLFQNLLPVPTFQNELFKLKRNNVVASGRGDSALNDASNENVSIDLEVLEFDETTPEVSHSSLSKVVD